MEDPQPPMKSNRPRQPRAKMDPKEIRTMYSPSELTRVITLNCKNIGKNLKQTLELQLKSSIEGKCISEGYIRTNSVAILNHSCGIVNGATIKFDVTFSCEIFNPTCGTLLRCKATSLSPAGITSTSATEAHSPFILHVIRDFEYKNPKFAKIEQDDEFTAEVIGSRFELGDTQITIFGNVK